MSINTKYLAAGLCGGCGEEPPLEGRQLGMECTKIRAIKYKSRPAKTGNAPGPKGNTGKRKAKHRFCWWCSRQLYAGGTSFVEKVIDGATRILHRSCAEQPETVKLTPPRAIPSRSSRYRHVDAKLEPPKTPVTIIEKSSGPQPGPVRYVAERRPDGQVLFL